MLSVALFAVLSLRVTVLEIPESVPAEKFIPLETLTLDANAFVGQAVLPTFYDLHFGGPEYSEDSPTFVDGILNGSGIPQLKVYPFDWLDPAV